jgi:hypothetical protein
MQGAPGVGPTSARPRRPRWDWTVVAALIVLVVVSLASAILIYDVEHPASPAVCTSLECGGVPLALNIPSETNRSGNWTYNFSVGAAGADVTFSSLNFQVETASGGTVVPGASWSLAVVGLNGSVLGTFDLIIASWTTGGTTQLSSQQTISLFSAHARLSGDSLIVLESGSGSFQGSISVEIP